MPISEVPRSPGGAQTPKPPASGIHPPITPACTHILLFPPFLGAHADLTPKRPQVLVPTWAPCPSSLGPQGGPIPATPRYCSHNIPSPQLQGPHHPSCLSPCPPSHIPECMSLHRLHPHHTQVPTQTLAPSSSIIQAAIPTVPCASSPLHLGLTITPGKQEGPCYLPSPAAAGGRRKPW